MGRMFSKTLSVAAVTLTLLLAFTSVSSSADIYRQCVEASKSKSPPTSDDMNICREAANAHWFETKKRTYAWTALSLMQNILRDVDGAIDSAGKAIELDPENKWVHNNLCSFLQTKENFEEALAHCDEALRIDPRYQMAIRNLSNTHFDLGQFDQAMRYGKMAIQFMPEDAWAYSYYANKLAKLGRWPEALENVNKALELDSKPASSYNLKAWTLLHLERHQEALDFANRALEINPESNNAIDTLGWVLFKMARFDESLVQLERAVAGFPGHPEMSAHLGDVYEALGRRQDAIEYWKKALLLKPKSFNNHLSETQAEKIRKKLAGGGGVLARTVAPIKSKTLNKYAVAVIIGNRDYAGRIPDVDFATNDADAFKAFVVDVLGYDPLNIIDLRDATRAQIESTFGNERSAEGKLWRFLNPRGKSDIAVFYSGHGVPGLKDGRGYLLPVDADPEAPEINGFAVDVLISNLQKLKAKSISVFLDACFSGDTQKGMLIRATSGIMIAPKMPKMTTKGMSIIAAAQSDEVASWDLKAKHGMFTKHLLDALYGAADGEEYGNGDGQIGLAEVKAYLDDNMTYAARREYGRRQNAWVQGEDATVLVRLPKNAKN